jgi:hypothetical protein
MDQPGKFAMRHAYILVVVVVLMCSNSLLAEPSAQSGMSDKAAIEQLFDRYVQAYSAKDYAKLREQLQAPFLRFPASVEVLPTIDDVMNYYRTQRDGLDQQNYGRSQFINSRITRLAVARALVNRTYRRYRKDGTVLLEASAVYLVSKSSGAWKICGIVEQDLADFAKVY